MLSAFRFRSLIHENHNSQKLSISLAIYKGLLNSETLAFNMTKQENFAGRVYTVNYGTQEVVGDGVSVVLPQQSRGHKKWGGGGNRERKRR